MKLTALGVHVVKILCYNWVSFSRNIKENSYVCAGVGGWFESEMYWRAQGRWLVKNVMALVVSTFLDELLCVKVSLF